MVEHGAAWKALRAAIRYGSGQTAPIASAFSSCLDGCRHHPGTVHRGFSRNTESTYVRPILACFFAVPIVTKPTFR